MKKRLISAVILMVIFVFALGTITVSAFRSGIYTYTVSGGEATITGCDNSVSGAITIPDKLGGYTVTSIGEYAFKYCTGLTSIMIPDSVTSIGDDAFFFCTGLTSVTIPDSVTSIGDGAFHCAGLTSITIPDSVETIGNFAFRECTGLTSITIPDSVTSIGSSAFYDCTGLTSVTIPDSVETIGNSAFRECTGLMSVTIPDSVTSIGNSAFSGCTGLTSVTIPDSVTTIGEDAFYGCTGLTEVNITDIAAWCNINFNNCYSNPLFHAKKLYLNGKLVTDLVITDGVTSIGEYAFSGCTGLTSITIPDSVTSIGEYAFYFCTGLTSVTIPDSVTSIGNYAFGGCSNIETVYYEGSESMWNGVLIDSKNECLTDAKIIFNTKPIYVGKTETVCLTPVNGNKIFMTIPSYIPENAEIILACYKDDRLTEVYSTPNKNETIYFISYKEFDTAKVMVWESFGNMKPVCEFENVVR